MSCRLHSDSMSNSLSLLDEANTLMHESLDLVKSNIDKFETNADLAGNNIDELISIHKILHTHHEELVKILESDKEVMQEFYDNANNYIEQGGIPTVWQSKFW